MDYTKIGTKIKETREAKNITVRELSEAVNVSISTISRIENNKLKSNSIVTVMDICKELGLDIFKDPINNNTDKILILKYDFDNSKNEKSNAIEKTVIGYVDNLKEAKKEVDRMKKKDTLYKGWDERHYPYYSIKKIEKL